MDDPHLLAALILLATVSVGLIRVLLLPGRVDRLLALQLLGTTAVAVVLLLAHGLDLPGLRDLALVLGLLASISAVAFVHYGGVDSDREGRGS
jgi:multicomponent Na+:H+ antiporter subunit F